MSLATWFIAICSFPALPAHGELVAEQVLDVLVVDVRAGYVLPELIPCDLVGNVGAGHALVEGLAAQPHLLPEDVVGVLVGDVRSRQSLVELLAPQSELLAELVAGVLVGDLCATHALVELLAAQAKLAGEGVHHVLRAAPVQHLNVAQLGTAGVEQPELLAH